MTIYRDLTPSIRRKISSLAHHTMSTLNSQDGRVRQTVSTLRTLNDEGLLSDGIVSDLLGCLLPRLLIITPVYARPTPSSNTPYHARSNSDPMQHSPQQRNLRRYEKRHGFRIHRRPSHRIRRVKEGLGSGIREQAGQTIGRIEDRRNRFPDECAYFACTT